MDHNPQGQGHGRRHFHRGRRGPDRRGPDRRAAQASHAPENAARNDVDVEQIMRDIRARISQRHGIELTNQQIQDLAARRLESILDPRTVNPALLDELRRATGAPATAAPREAEPAYAFNEQTLFESHNAVTRFFRKLLLPILKLFFNPTPIARALEVQARLNTEAAAREAERERQQAEWNALHYEILRKLVLEVSRVSVEAQALGMKVESLAAKVDFNERRVRGIEGAVHQSRPAPRRETTEVISATAAALSAPEAAAPEASGTPQAGTPGDGTRRRRRRRRGRRGGAGAGEATAPGSEGTALDVDAEVAEGSDQDDASEEDDVANAAGEEDSPAVAEALAASEPDPLIVTAAPESEPAQATPAHPAAPPDGPERREEEPPER